MTLLDLSGATWRGWAAGRSGPSVEVTSSRLGGDAQVQNRLFPKMRSWFALGAPLELLSPLSVVRLLLVLVAVGWPVTAVLGGWPGDRRWAVWVATAAAGGAWAALLPVRRLGPLASYLVATAIVPLADLVLWAGAGRGGALVVAPTLCLVASFVAMFLGGRALVAHLGVVGTGLLAVGVLALGTGAGVATAAVTVTAVAATGSLVWLLVRSVQRAGAVDPATGLLTDVGLDQGLARAQPGVPVLVAVLNLGGLADAREALGHPVATELMRRAVENVGQVLPDDALIGRLGDDELVVGLRPGGVAEDGAGEPPAGGPPAVLRAAGEDLADRLADAVGGGRYLAGSVEVALRPHVGVAVGPWEGTGTFELVRRAALGAQTARDAGERTGAWDGTDDRLSADDLALLSDLRLAPERGELWMAYQPQVDAGTGRLAAVEALLRWDSPRHGSVPPGRFIPMAERTGLVDRLTEWVFVTVLDAAARWRRAGIELPVSVNVSARTVGQPGLAEWIVAQLASRALPAATLTVEVTETAAVDPRRALHLLGPLHDRGVRVSIDDFGTGYTSLAALPQLPVDEIKVDMGFVRRSATSPADEAIVRSVRDLAHRLGLTSVAEGVEDEGLRRSMADIGFDLLQGYHFSRPLSEAQLLDLVAASGALPIYARSR